MGIIEKGKILEFPCGIDNYYGVANEKMEQGDYESALGLLFSALKKQKSPSIYSKIADCYSEMGLISLSNAYWFLYLSVCEEAKQTIAYEQLAINYFYMDNYFVSSYYFHLKLSKDGYISKEGLDEEVLNFFNQTLDKRSAYYLAYPFDRADFSFKEKLARQALAAGDYSGAEKLYSDIPLECMNEQTNGELAISLFLNKKDKQVIEVCKDSLSRHGENVTAYCNLSSLYHAKGDKEKSAYYYSQALKVNTWQNEECYKLATCSMEQNDHQTANICLQKILKERTYDVTMSFFYAVSLANLGKFSDSARAFSQIYRIYPNDRIAKFYAEYLQAIVDGAGDSKNIFPLPYVKNLPPSIVKAYKRKISELFSDPKKGLTQIKRKDVQDIIKWALIQEEGEYAKHSVFILSNSNTKWAEKTMLNALMDIDVSGDTKRAIITMLVLSGYKETFSVIANDFLVKVKPKKLVCENRIDGDVFVAAYAICLSRMTYWNIDAFDKIAFAINKVYKKLGGEVYIAGLTPEEIGAIAVCLCKLERLTNPDYVCKFFDARANIVKDYLKIVKGDKNGKNN